MCRPHLTAKPHRLVELRDAKPGVEAVGGGTKVPEAVLPGLQWAMERSGFRPKARKVILLFGDAPPYPADVAAGVRLAGRFRVRRRGKLSTVTCRIPHPIAEMRAIAQAGGGEALVLLYHERLLEKLVVLIFGERFRSDVYRFFEFDPPSEPHGNATSFTVWPTIQGIAAGPRPTERLLKPVSCRARNVSIGPK